MRRILRNFNPQCPLVARHADVLDRDAREPLPVKEGALFGDPDHLQPTILVDGIRPPTRRVMPAALPRIAGACPIAEQGVVDIEMDVRRPILGDAWRFRAELKRNLNLLQRMAESK